MATISLIANAIDDIPGLPPKVSSTLYTLACPDELAPILKRGVDAILGSPTVNITLDTDGQALTQTVAVIDDLHPEIAALIPKESFKEPIGPLASAIVRGALHLPLTVTASLEFVIS